MRTWGGVFALVLFSSQVALAGPGVTAPTRPEPIIGGELVELCAWPTVVRIGGCTGNLIHPEIVIYAAHCGTPGSVTFGESGSPVTVPAQCTTNPGYNDTQGTDWAICKLSQPVDLPVTPILFGCETDMLMPGTPISIVGFGATSDAGGFGTKYWADTYINSVGQTTINLGGGGVGSCPGDSGGPLMIEMADGSWRTTGITSTYGGVCGTPNTYARTDVALPWFESVVGMDLTPCHDSDTGAWNPGPECTGFYAGGSEGSGTWMNLCEGTPVSGPSDSCGEPFGAGDDEPPIVTITAPADGEIFEDAPADIDVTIDAEDPGSVVTAAWLDIDGTELDVKDEAEPWEFMGVTFPKGTYVITAIAEDFNGAQGRSEPITIYVGEEPPGETDTGGTTGGGSETTDGAATGDDGSDTSDGDDTGAGQSEDKGCACASSDRPAPLYAFVVFGLVALRRRRTLG